MPKTTGRPVIRASLLALILVLFGSSQLPFAQATENLTAEYATRCLPDLLSIHLTQHDMDNAFMQRVLKQFVLQLDPNKVFYLKSEADALAAMSDEDLRALATRVLTGDLSHFSKILQAFLDTQITRDAALFEGLETRKDEIKALGEEKPKSEADNQRKPDEPALRENEENHGGLEDDADKIEWGDRSLTQADREKRILRMAAALFKLNTSYLSENEAFKQAVLTVRDWRSPWLKPGVKNDVPKFFLKSFMSALDPHSEYMDSEEGDDFTDRLERSFAGIGVQIRPCPLGALIESVIKGGPSDKSGKFSPGDQIIRVDETSLAALPINKIVKLIKGQLGTEVKLTLLKYDTHLTEAITLKRDKIELADMRVKDEKYESPQGTIAVISVQSFYKDVHLDVRDKLRALSAGKPLAGVVLDLRYNHGGYLDEAIMLTGLFIESGYVVGERDGWGGVDWKMKEPTEPSAEYLGPLAVLVNQFSASASEIVAGALQDYNRAIIVGATQTFGKGTVQRVIPMQRSNLPGEIKITTHQYFLPGGASVQLKGVEPDVYIPGPKLLDEEGMLERADKNAVPWNKIKSALDNKTPGVKLWHEWKEKNAAALQEKSKQRVAANPEFKDAFDPKKLKQKEKAEAKPRLPDEPPPIVDANKKEPDLQAQEAAAVVKDMLATWPPAPAEVAK